jgi:hypothetical protein
VPDYERRPATQVGIVYLLHFEARYPFGRQPRHYIGFTSTTVARRLRDHLRGNGNSLVLAVHRLGIGVTVARTWEGVTRDFERQLKSLKKIGRDHCPLCKLERSINRMKAAYPPKEN